MTRPRAPRAAQIGVALLALACVGLTLRATLSSPDARAATLVGHFDGLLPRVHALMQRLGAGLLLCQEEDGGFRADEDVSAQHNDDAERVAVSALVAAALAQLEVLDIDVPDLRARAATVRAYLRVRQSSRGAVLGTPPGDVRLQIEATAAAAWAWLIKADALDAASLGDAADALRRLGADGFDNGYPRALVAMWTERVAAQGRQEDVLNSQARDLVRWREYKKLPEERGFELWDTSLAEAIARTTLGHFARKQGAVDPFPTRVLKKVLETPPEWTGASSDVQGWWLQAWLAARSGQGAPWFEALLGVIEEWTDEETGLLPGGYYAAAVPQSALAILALAEGLRAAR